MKKIISLIVFAVALVWTWNIIHNSPTIGFETHSGIQEKLTELILKTIKSKKPAATQLQVTRLWTEPLSDNKVRAVFAYKFNEPAEGNEATEQSIEGEAILHREVSEDKKVDKWTLQSVKTTNDVLVFAEGSLVRPGGEESLPTEASGTTAAPNENDTSSKTPETPAPAPAEVTE